MATVSHDSTKPAEVFEQFETLEQQQDTYLVGMWAFLVTEVMFFGALFLAYVVYRWKYQGYFYEVHNELDMVKGGINTVILLTSSLTMALAVHYAQLKDKKRQLQMLGATLLGAFGFLGVKTLEYGAKFQHGLFPGPNFKWDNPDVPASIAQLFFSLYFAATGLHVVHVIIGILVIGALALLVAKDSPLVKGDYIPTEMVGLYWHFVDIVWIFLFPLFYLIPK